MKFLRQRLSLLSIGWLFCQTVSLSAFLPLDCCPAHRAAAATSLEECPVSAEACPLEGAAGQMCPMHGGHSAQSGPGGSGASDADRTQACTMRGLCNGPSVALGSLLSIPGVLIQTSDIHVDVSETLSISWVDRIPNPPASTDTPPPRA